MLKRAIDLISACAGVAMSVLILWGFASAISKTGIGFERRAFAMLGLLIVIVRYGLMRIELLIAEKGSPASDARPAHRVADHFNGMIMILSGAWFLLVVFAG